MSNPKDFVEFTVSVYIAQIGHVALLFFGTVGNVLSIAVWVKSRRRMMSSVVFLITLAVVDLVVLLSGSGRHAVRNLFQYDIRHYHLLICKINIYLVMAGGQVSAWILVAITIERVVSVAYPLKVSLLCTTRRHLVVIAVIFIVIGGLNAHLLYGFDLYAKTNNSKPICDRIQEYNRFYLDIYVLFHLFSLCLIPIAILLAGNIFILIQTKRVRRSTMTRNSQISQTGSDAESGHSSARISSVLTRRVVILGVTFFICNAPYTLYALLYESWVLSGMSPHEVAIDVLIAQLSIVLVYTNNAVNFYLYCAVGTKFRHDAIALFCGNRRRSSSGTQATRIRSSSSGSAGSSVRY